MGWVIALAVIVLLAWLPLGIGAKYDSSGVAAWLLLGPIPVPIYPGKHKKSAQKQEKVGETGTSGGKEKGGALSNVLPIVRLVVDFLRDFRRKLRVRNLVVHAVLAGDDPCDLAVNYGRGAAALGGLIPLLEQALVIQKRDIQIVPNFTADQTRVVVRLELTVTLGRLVILCCHHGKRFVREILKNQKFSKGGAMK